MALRRLGKNLTLINVAVSGAILLAIAFAALSVTQGIISNQYDSDLHVFTRWFLQAANESINAEDDIEFRLPAEYIMLALDDSGQVRMMGAAPFTDEEITDLFEKMTRLYSEKLQSFFDKGTDPFMESISLESLKPKRLARLWKSARGVGFFMWPGEEAALRIAYTMEEHLLVQWKDVPLRVSVTIIRSENSPTVLLILQNRTDELAVSVSLRRLFTGCIVGGMLFIVIASLYISARAIRPIERSIKQQQAFVAAASHELRTPVAALLANAEVLSDASLGEYSPYLESVLHVSKRISSLVSDMIDLARADVGELSIQKMAVDAGEAAEKAVLWMRPLAEQKGIALSVSAAPLFVQADSDRLRQVLLVLLDNAVRYTEKGSHVDVSVAKKNHFVEITVSDDGNGIPDAHKAHVFERFYRLDEARSRESGGVGLGLSIAKRLVEQMEGSITLTDRIGGGACFRILFKQYKT